MILIKKASHISVIFALLAMVACDSVPTTPPQSASGATQAKPTTVPKNSNGNTVEQQNVEDRLKVTQDPTKIMWIHLISLDGKILRRMPIRNKVTSSGKRLEPMTASTYGNQYSSGSLPAYGGYYTSELIGPDGTYGSSDPYIFWFDPMGRYHQWGTAGGLGYLLTDYPIDLANPVNEITGLYNAHTAAAKWQAEQEAELRKKEGK
ncbi:MAG: hypothetical protein UT43_C0047G0003 [Parcubacteria group bacterium GW2011_GWC1_39_29]|nr:MAG: hypothetical protein UT43_C0047G0003 [Parcubacteria group bacterium GW2011_GWC1_39_29]